MHARHWRHAKPGKHITGKGEACGGPTNYRDRQRAVRDNRGKCNIVISRRLFLLTTPLLISGCMTQVRTESPKPTLNEQYSDMYGPIVDEPFPVAAVDLKRVNPKYLRQEVAYATSETPGTVIIDTDAKYAYLVLEQGRAIRYGVGVGKTEALSFKGEARIARKAEWPRWRPTQDMIKRDPGRYVKLAEGLEGGPMNPLGPRALYLYRDGQDTLYRLHGTVEPWTIGTMVSSGCIRFLNQDIIDLYRRVPVGSKVVVLSAGSLADRPAAPQVT